MPLTARTVRAQPRSLAAGWVAVVVDRLAVTLIDRKPTTTSDITVRSLAPR